MIMAEKLYVVVREDLPPGPQAVQAMHAFRQFQEAFPGLERNWFDTSNHLALLSVRNEDALRGLVARASIWRIRHVGFHEPDLGDALTAVAFEPGRISGRLLRDLKLALHREPLRRKVGHGNRERTQSPDRAPD